MEKMNWTDDLRTDDARKLVECGVVYDLFAIKFATTLPATPPITTEEDQMMR